MLDLLQLRFALNFDVNRAMRRKGHVLGLVVAHAENSTPKSQTIVGHFLNSKLRSLGGVFGDGNDSIANEVPTLGTVRICRRATGGSSAERRQQREKGHPTIRNSRD